MNLKSRMIGCLGLLVLPAMAQVQYDTTFAKRVVKHFQLPVTYYDYHNDGSNPEFATRVLTRFESSGAIRGLNLSGWADSTLPASKIPKRAAGVTNPYSGISWNLEKLFLPWTPGVTDSFTVRGDTVFAVIDTVITPRVVGPDTMWDTSYVQKSPGSRAPDTLIKNDTLFKNVVIPDSLRYTWSLAGLDSAWVGGSANKTDPIGGRGFGNEGDVGNFCYAMSLHNKFVYHAGDTLTVGADDDFYVYINNKLAIEGGGIHAIRPISVSLDSLGLTANTKYDIDAFYVERRTGGGFYMKGLSDFEAKSSGEDTVTDTILTPVVGVKRPGIAGRDERSVLGVSLSAATAKVRIEYFTLAGARIASVTMGLEDASALRTVPTLNGRALSPETSPKAAGIYLIRLTSLDAMNRVLATNLVHQLCFHR